MPSRLDLHNELLTFIPNVYFQPPSNTLMKYPCIVYNKTVKDRKFANDAIYLSKQSYQLMIVERTPDSEVADDIEKHFPYCAITQHYAVDNLNHTTLSLYY